MLLRSHCKKPGPLLAPWSQGPLRCGEATSTGVFLGDPAAQASPQPDEHALDGPSHGSQGSFQGQLAGGWPAGEGGHG